MPMYTFSSMINFTQLTSIVLDILENAKKLMFEDSMFSILDQKRTFKGGIEKTIENLKFNGLSFMNEEKLKTGLKNSSHSDIFVLFSENNKKFKSKATLITVLLRDHLDSKESIYEEEVSLNNINVDIIINDWNFKSTLSRLPLDLTRIVFNLQEVTVSNSKLLVKISNLHEINLLKSNFQQIENSKGTAKFDTEHVFRCIACAENEVSEDLSQKSTTSSSSALCMIFSVRESSFLLIGKVISFNVINLKEENVPLDLSGLPEFNRKRLHFSDEEKISFFIKNSNLIDLNLISELGGFLEKEPLNLNRKGLKILLNELIKHKKKFPQVKILISKINEHLTEKLGTYLSIREGSYEAEEKSRLEEYYRKKIRERGS